MPSAPSYSPADLFLFTHVLDLMALEAGGLDEGMRAKIGLRITMGFAAGLRSIDDLAACAREALAAERFTPFTRMNSAIAIRHVNPQRPSSPPAQSHRVGYDSADQQAGTEADQTRGRIGRQVET